MYLFTRRTRLKFGNGPAGTEWAGRICDTVRRITDQDVALWSTVYSPRSGTISWVLWVPDLVALETLTDKLATDPTYLALVNDGGILVEGGIDAALMRPIHHAPESGADAMLVNSRYVVTTTAAASPGSLEKATTAAVDFARTSESLTGVPTMVCREMTGPYGGFVWFTPYEDIAALQSAQEKLDSDSSWLQFIDRTEGCWTGDPSVTHTTIHRRLG